MEVQQLVIAAVLIVVVLAIVKKLFRLAKWVTIVFVILFAGHYLLSYFSII